MAISYRLFYFYSIKDLFKFISRATLDIDCINFYNVVCITVDWTGLQNFKHFFRRSSCSSTNMEINSNSKKAKKYKRQSSNSEASYCFSEYDEQTCIDKQKDFFSELIKKIPYILMQNISEESNKNWVTKEIRNAGNEIFILHILDVLTFSSTQSSISEWVVKIVGSRFLEMRLLIRVFLAKLLVDAVWSQVPTSDYSNKNKRISETSEL